MKKLNLSIIKGSILVLLMLASSANAAVHVDEEGIGFVGKGDIQSVFNWNNSMLQENAHLIQFKFSRAGTVSWVCEGVNAAGVTIRSDRRNEDIGASTYVAYDARRNRTGQITGFLLVGLIENSTTQNEIGSCGNSVGFQVPFQLVSEINYEGSTEPSLKVSIDGVNYFDLQITY